MNDREIRRRPSKPEFAVAGLVLGGCAGMVVGLILEIVWRRSMIVMQVSGVAGIAIGALAESIRYGWRKHVFRLSSKERKS